MQSPVRRATPSLSKWAGPGAKIPRMSRSLSRLPWAASGVLLAAACAAGPSADAIGEPTPVEVLDAAFVRFEGHRVPLEAFLLEMRARARSAAGDPARLPWVQVSVDPEAKELPLDYMTRLRQELYKSGIRFVDLGK